MMSVFKVLVILFVTGLVAGCKVAVIVVEGGEVLGLGSCAERTICIIEVNDTNFYELFQAVPNPGWHFVRWNNGRGFLCGDSTSPDCAVSTEGFAGNTELEAIIASDDTYYLMPVFEFEPDTVIVDGKEWLQPADFLGYTLDQVKAVCPAGACMGSLPGSTFDLTGYTWASIMDVTHLFNAYGVNPPFTEPFQTRDRQDAAWTAITRDFEHTGWTCGGDCHFEFLFLIGWVRDPAATVETAYMAYAFYVNSDFRNAATLPPWGPLEDDPDTGGVGIWLWRPAQSPY